MTSQATLRFLGHMGRNGGSLWALKAAERYFPEGHLLLRAYQTRCNHDITSTVPEQHKQNRFTQSTREHKTKQKLRRADPLLLTKERTYSSRRDSLQAMITKRR
jgi:hypothetical protein